jgi:putative ABC transport system permease protein
MMIKNHLKLAFRNLLKRKGYSLLNILGLGIGITCCLLIFQYVAYEKSYESFNKTAAQVMRLRLDSYQKGKLAWQSATSYPAIGPTMKKDFPEVQNFCRLIDANLLLSNPDKNIKFNETKGYYADPSALNMLGVTLLKGNPATALNGPDKILLSETMARKYFGNEEALGKRLTARDGQTQHYEVTGIFKDYAANSHLILNHLVSYSTLGKLVTAQGDSSNATETSFGWYDYYTYVQLKPGADWKTLQAKLPAFCDRYINGQEWNKKNNVKESLFLIPLTDIHLYSNYNQEAEVNGNGKAIGFLFLIAFFIIVIAWVNYTNLATARSLERAREVGVRKVLGAIRRDLIAQFLTESLLMNLLAFFLALGSAFLLSPSFNTLIGSEQAGSFSLPLNYSLGLGVMFLAGAFLSGIYPAFVLSGYHPIAVLKGLFRNSSKGLVLRKSLIIGQFAISVILIAGTILVYQQVQYMRRQQLGANINQTLVIEGANALQDSLYKNVFQPFKTSLLRQTGIRSVTASSSVMGKEIYWTNGINRVGESDKAVTLYHLGVDYDFVPAYGLQLAAGRNFSRDFGTDQKAVLINEKAADLLGFKTPADALNSKLKRGGDTVSIIGVLADYHHQGLQKAIDPMLILLIPNIRGYYSVKVNTDDPQTTIAAIQKNWSRYFPDDPFNYFFLDESFNQQYKSDIRFGQVFALFAFLAILIACFGLLGLSAYNVLQRTKEIGIRKVLGASVQNLVLLLSKEFLLLVFISLFIAIPVTWWVMNNWLQDFAYRIAIHWWVFAIAGSLAILIALSTVGFQAIRAALANPVKSLRTE